MLSQSGNDGNKAEERGGEDRRNQPKDRAENRNHAPPTTLSRPCGSEKCGVEPRGWNVGEAVERMPKLTPDTINVWWMTNENVCDRGANKSANE